MFCRLLNSELILLYHVLDNIQPTQVFFFFSFPRTVNGEVNRMFAQPLFTVFPLILTILHTLDFIHRNIQGKCRIKKKTTSNCRKEHSVTGWEERKLVLSRCSN